MIPKVISRSKNKKVTATALIRRDFSWNWNRVNPVLDAEELSYEIDTDTFRLGDGVSKWSMLESYSKENK